MRPQAGLTLLEVLMSVLILALLAAAVTPLLRSSLGQLDVEPEPISGDASSLAELIEQFVRQPEPFGYDRIPDQGRIEWPDEPLRPALAFRRLGSTDPEAQHAWLVFETEAGTMLRWVPTPDEEVGADEESER